MHYDIEQCIKDKQERRKQLFSQQKERYTKFPTKEEDQYIARKRSADLRQLLNKWFYQPGEKITDQSD